MSNTHIIIPIKDIEAQIIEERGIVKSFEGSSLNIARYHQHKLGFLESLSRGVLNDTIVGKQISLDEKDIEEKAHLYAMDNKVLGSKYRQEGYSQALKDLL